MTLPSSTEQTNQIERTKSAMTLACIKNNTTTAIEVANSCLPVLERHIEKYIRKVHTLNKKRKLTWTSLEIISQGDKYLEWAEDYYFGLVFDRDIKYAVN